MRARETESRPGDVVDWAFESGVRRTKQTQVIEAGETSFMIREEGFCECTEPRPDCFKRRV
jgi:hypothetical protein